MSACDKEFMEMRLSAFEDLEKMTPADVDKPFPNVRVTPRRLVVKVTEVSA